MGNPKIKGEREGVVNLKVEGNLNYKIEGEREGVGTLDVEGDLEYEIESVGHLEHKIEVDLEVEGDIEVEGDGDLEDDDKGDLVSEGEHVFFRYVFIYLVKLTRRYRTYIFI